jgi:two-component system sensor histidine kinase GlrK
MGAGVAPEAVARAVHDLYGPLTVIRGLCATLGRDEPRADRRRGLELIDGEALRLAAGLESLVASPLPPRHSRRVALAALAAEAVERHGAVAAARGVRLTVRLPGDPVEVEGHAPSLERALDNLIHNGLRHTPDGGEVSVGVSAARGRAHLRVRDEGPGIAPGDRRLIFRAGERGSAPRGRGKGLGLAIAREIAEAHGGRLTLDREGPGACFRLSFPLVASAPCPAAA